MNIPDLYQIFLKNPSVQTDTRKLKKGDIFFALKGDNFNGNSFAQKALTAGASYAVIDEKEFYMDDRTIVVNDVLITLQQLAQHHRQQFQIPFLAITGSNGKTTTKELVYSVLASHYKTATTQGNLNNHIGVPLTLLSIQPGTELAVIEMGANHRGEIASYCEYTMPTHGLITNCGKAHLEGFGGEEGVRKGKGELFDYLKDHQGTAFIMNDYDYLRSMSSGISEIYTYGTREADVTGKALKTEPFLSVEFDEGFGGVEGFGGIKGIEGMEKIITTHLVGDYNLPNVLAAVAVGKFFNVPEEKIKSSIENYLPSNSRSQLVEKGNKKIILDAYNANPSSMKLAIENFAKMDAEKKILVLGAMAELGSESLDEHAAIAREIKKYNWDEVILVGGDFEKIDHGFTRFSSPSAAGEWLKEKAEDATLLIKGSRSMQMEKVLDYL